VQSVNKIIHNVGTDDKVPVSCSKDSPQS